MMELLVNNSGMFMGGLAIVIAVALSGVASSKGVEIVGEAAASLMTEQPEKFGKVLILELLPSTQGLYGFVIGFLMLSKVTTGLTFGEGMFLILAALPVAITALASAPSQARVAAVGVQILAKKPNDMMKGVVLAAMIETYALLGFLVSFFLVFKI